MFGNVDLCDRGPPREAISSGNRAAGDSELGEQLWQRHFLGPHFQTEGLLADFWRKFESTSISVSKLVDRELCISHIAFCGRPASIGHLVFATTVRGHLRARTALQRLLEWRGARVVSNHYVCIASRRLRALPLNVYANLARNASAVACPVITPREVDPLRIAYVSGRRIRSAVFVLSA